MSKSLSSVRQKIRWLVENRQIWHSYPIRAMDIERVILNKMKDDGLVSKNTHNQHFLDLGRLIGEARSEIRSAKNKKTKS